MTNYEKIKFLLDMGVYKGVEVEMYDETFVIRDEFMLNVHDLQGDMKHITSITPIPNPPKLLPVGTKVRVFEEYDYTRWKKEYEIDSISIGEYILKCRGSIFRCPFRAVVPVLE